MYVQIELIWPLQVQLSQHTYICSIRNYLDLRTMIQWGAWSCTNSGLPACDLKSLTDTRAYRSHSQSNRLSLVHALTSTHLMKSNPQFSSNMANRKINRSKIIIITSLAEVITLYSSGAKASVPEASNKLGEWVSDWVIDRVRDFSPRASSARGAANETKFGTKVA